MGSKRIVSIFLFSASKKNSYIDYFPAEFSAIELYIKIVMFTFKY